MTDFYFVRHGQTEWNLERRFQGGSGDSALLPSSYDDMARLGRYLAPVHFDHIYSSPLKRALVTANRVSKYLKPIQNVSVRSALSEVGLGQWEGMLVRDVQQKYPEAYDTYRHDLDHFEGQGFDGEGYTHTAQRFARFINGLAAQYPNDKILIVSHGMALSFGINALLQQPRMSIRERGGLSNTSTTILTTSDAQHYTVKKWNDISYLNKVADETTTV